ncbi:tRNA N(3)-methylcytidine methyltransferase Mettl2 isoform X4 [Plodia interpunctella]|uniref:tRNA N(3)-methylcytidine methyltransferase Mettl2 isoform X4 n=1 Tax=Plodia interpunctella TaxID=58824 RepID=UPI0023674976|nr:tRNA N(3)-methylcytidine methyltransferase Mettl2 isoform X4 [Plodia interpunctella]
MLMKSSNIMRGIVFTTYNRKFFKKSNFCREYCEYLEKTRYRKKPAGGSRYLADKKNVYLFNAWDNVQWDAEQENAAKAKVEQNSQVTFSEDHVKSLEENADKHWDAFYDIHQNRFFKDRHWLFTEFPELAPDNTTSPVRVFPEAESKNTSTLSTLQDDKSKRMPTVINNIHKYLKPGGLMVFRDYGKYDLAQLRFKKGRCISDNFYARGDNTRVYFFTQQEITELFNNAGFIEEQNLIDRRLQVNRGKMLTMYRVWIQGKYRKPL